MSNDTVLFLLIRVNGFDKAAVTPLEEWMKYLKDGTIRPDTAAPGYRLFSGLFP